ncbi:MAG: RNA polymerase sigma factor [Planctomycetota bacterium]
MSQPEASQPPVPSSPQPKWQTCDEVELIDAARCDREAFGELYRRHYSAIANYVYRRTGRDDATEDLLSEVFLAVLQGLQRYRHRGVPFRHWVYRIATHKVNRWARTQRRNFLSLDAVGPNAQAAPTEGEAMDVQRLLPQLLSLKPKQQAVLTLHYVEGLSVDEVAQVLKVPAGTVKSRLARARAALEERLRRGEGRS